VIPLSFVRGHINAAVCIHFNHKPDVTRGLLQGFFGKVVVDSFDPSILLSTWATHPIDFETAKVHDLEDFMIPLSFVCKGPSTLHGVACWFDVFFAGSTQQTWLSTAPGMPPTHWFQLRCVFQV
jgi:histone-arginine methyltransferase CARM1